MKNIKFIFILSVLVLFSGCIETKQIGKLNMVSNRNIDQSKNYKQLTTYSGGSKRELKKTRAKTMEDAIDATVRKVPGGEYLMNVKVYLVNSTYIAVEGDVWGNSENSSFKGYKVGDKVTWKTDRNIIQKTAGAPEFSTGVINALIGDTKCLIKVDGDDKLIELEYDKIIK